MTWTLQIVLLVCLWVGVGGYLAHLYLSWRKLFVAPGVSEATWQAAICFIIQGTTGLIVAIFEVMTGHPLLALIAAPVALLLPVGLLVIEQGITIIKAEPPHVGKLTFWGNRQDINLPEGEYLLPKFWPLRIDVIQVKVEAISFEFNYENVPCKAAETSGSQGVGAFVRVKVVGALEPDHSDEERENKDSLNGANGGRRITNYLNRGGEEGVLKLINGIIGQEIREYALRYTWEQFMALKAPLAATLITLISDARPRRLRRNGDSIETVEGKVEGYLEPGRYDIIDNPMVYIDEAGSNDKERQNRVREMEIFLQALREGGFGDVPDLGVQFLRFTIPEIEPTGAVKEAADKAAAEKKQKEQESQDTSTEIMLAEMYVDASRPTPDGEPTMTFTDALEKVRLRRNPGTREIIIRGSTGQFADAAAIMADSQAQKGA